MAAAKIIDAQVLANGASVTKTLSVNGFEWVAVELTNDQTCDLSVTASTVDGTTRVRVASFVSSSPTRST